MAIRFLISDDGVAKQVQKYAVAVDGQSREIIRAAVAQGGVVRQYYPHVPDDDDERITWGTTTLNVRQQSVFPDGSHASIWFVRGNGFFQYKNFPNADLFATYLQPPLDGTPADDGKYLIRASIVSGSNLSGSPTEVWLDLNADPQYLWEAVVNAAGQFKQSQYIFSIAADDGAGNPVASTQISRTINFDSEVLDLAGSELIWDQVQRDLVEVKEGEDADCSVSMQPTGTCIGDADTTGSFVDRWITDGADSLGYTVRADLVSGETPEGSSLGVDLPLDTVREWTLTAGIIEVASLGEDLNTTLDITVTDTLLVVSTTKRVTMNAVRTEPSVPPVWNTDQWNLSDVGHAQPESHNVNAHVIFQLDGTAIGRIDNDNLDEVQETDPWLPAGEDASDYEVKSRGSQFLTSHVDNQWYPMTSEQHFLFEHITLPKIRTFVSELSVRKIGSLTITKDLATTVTGAIDDGTQPN